MDMSALTNHKPFRL